MSNLKKSNIFLKKKKSEIFKQIFPELKFYFLVFLFTLIFSNESLANLDNDMDMRSKKTRFSVKEPDFFASGNFSQWAGIYFGVGFRKIRLRLLDDIVISDSDGEANGIGFNLGYFWEERGVEFERQKTIVKVSEPLIYENQESKLLEVVQNNFWYIRYPKINRFLYFQYGYGIQFTKTRLAGFQIKKSYKDEVALGIETGISCYVTSNMLILYRFSLGQQIPFLSNDSEKKFLIQSQIHTIYLNYFLPL